MCMLATTQANTQAHVQWFHLEFIMWKVQYNYGSLAANSAGLYIQKWAQRGFSVWVSLFFIIIIIMLFLRPAWDTLAFLINLKVLELALHCPEES